MYLCDVCTVPVNLAGHPGMSVPFGTGDGGLPIGVQVLAPALGEATMFRAARDRAERVVARASRVAIGTAVGRTRP